MTLCIYDEAVIVHDILRYSIAIGKAKEGAGMFVEQKL